jgi:Ca-activated chloride channel homolog
MAEQLQLSATLNKPAVPVTSSQQLLYVLIEAQPSEVVAQVRMQLNFGFVLDRSGSMRGSKIARLIEAVELALSRMQQDDLVSITIFSDSARVLVPTTTLSSRGSLASQVRRIRAGGGTEMSRGISLGLREVYQHREKDRIDQVLLLTDGQTHGDEPQCLKLAREAGEHAIPIQALGLGDDWNENLLDEIGTLSGGDADLVETADDIVPLFTETVQRSQQAVLQNGHLTMRLVAGVAPRQVWQVTPMISNLGYTPLGEHDVQVPLGELDAVQGKAILIELLIPARRPGRYRLAQAEVTYDIPSLGLRNASVRAPIVVDYTRDQNLTTRYNPRIMNIVERVTAFKLQTRALQEAKLGDIDGATRKLRAAATRLLELGEEELATAATQEADNLERSGQMSSSGSKKLRYQTRKLTQKLPDLPDEEQDS